MQDVAGTVAAAGSPLLLSIGLILWDKNWTGSAIVLNALKCSVASLGFLVVSLGILADSATGATSLGTEEKWRGIAALVTSGLIGIVIGDSLWLLAMERLGAVRVILIDATKPFVIALLGWVFTGEAIQPLGLVGMVFTMGCIVLVSTQVEGEAQVPELVCHDTAGSFDDQAPRANAVAPTPYETRECNESDQGHADIELVGMNRTVSDNTTSLVLEGFDHNEPALGPERLGSPALTHQIRNSTESSGDSVCSADLGNRTSAASRSHSSSRNIGHLFAVLNVVFDSFGYILTKKFSAGFNTFEISGIRFGSSAAILAVGLLSMRLVHHLDASSKYCKALRQNQDSSRCAWWLFPTISNKALAMIFVGIAFTTFGAPALANFALFKIPLATFATLMAMTPVWSIPVSFLIIGNVPTVRAVLGSIGACLGVIPLYI